jgi:hypothetical protein
MLSARLVVSLVMGYFQTTMRAGPLAIRAAVIILAAALPAALPAAGQDLLEALVPEPVRRELASGAPVVRPLSPDSALSLLPSVASAGVVAADVREARPTVGAEVLLVLEGMAGDLGSAAGMLRIYNSLHAVSTLKGITYWSASRKQERVLFTESFAIASPGQVTRIADPVFQQVPAEDVLYTFQQDQTYGKNTYSQRFTAAPDHLLVRIHNTSKVTVALIPLVQPGGFVSECILVPSGGDLLFYGVSYIRTSMPIGDRRARQDSLANRLIAMASWLRTRLS